MRNNGDLPLRRMVEETDLMNAWNTFYRVIHCKNEKIMQACPVNLSLNGKLSLQPASHLFKGAS